MNLKELSTKQIHDYLKKIALANNVIMKGNFPGMAFLDIKESHDLLQELHSSYLEEFKIRPDAEEFEPNIHKVGTAEIVGA